MSLIDTADTRCALTTAQSPHHQGPDVRQYSGDVRVVNLPSDTYQHYSELQSSSDTHTVITLHDRVLLLALLSFRFVFVNYCNGSY